LLFSEVAKERRITDDTKLSLVIFCDFSRLFIPEMHQDLSILALS